MDSSKTASGKPGAVHIEKRRTAYREQQRIRLVSLGEASGRVSGSAAQLAALEALRRHGALSQKEIADRTTTPFKNPRSLDLVLRNFERRGIVRRVNIPERGAAVIWELVPEAGYSAPSNPEKQ